MNADQAKILAQSVGTQLQHEWMTTYKVISAVPEGKRDYKPEPNSRSAWDLATHIAGADVWFLDGVINGEFSKPSETAPAPTVAGVADWYKKEFRARPYGPPPRAARHVSAPDGRQGARHLRWELRRGVAGADGTQRIAVRVSRPSNVSRSPSP